MHMAKNIVPVEAFAEHSPSAHAPHTQVRDPTVLRLAVALRRMGMSVVQLYGCTADVTCALEALSSYSW